MATENVRDGKAKGKAGGTSCSVFSVPQGKTVDSVGGWEERGKRKEEARVTAHDQ